MSKYIDADKLKAEIERVKAEKTRIYEMLPKDDLDAVLSYAQRECLKQLGYFITSLQQEQPFPRWIHANYSDKPEIRYTPSGIPYLQNGTHMIWLSDLDTLPKDGTDLTNPIQEQPEEDLENIIRVEFGTRAKVEDGRRYVKLNWDKFSILARHFYELGKIARKEETK